MRIAVPGGQRQVGHAVVQRMENHRRPQRIGRAGRRRPSTRPMTEAFTTSTWAGRARTPKKSRRDAAMRPPRRTAPRSRPQHVRRGRSPPRRAERRSPATVTIAHASAARRRSSDRSGISRSSGSSTTPTVESMQHDAPQQQRGIQPPRREKRAHGPLPPRRRRR